jgi:adenylyltransferase/sulfurtransferase
MTTREFRFERRLDCAVCGERPSITVPSDETAGECDLAALGGQIERTRPPEVRQLLQGSASPSPGSPPATPTLMLVDVREPREYAVAHLREAINIPVAELSSRLSEVPAGTRPVFICRSGVRSQTACSIAIRGGVAAAINLEGGLLAWAAEVDPSFVVAPAR